MADKPAKDKHSHHDHDHDSLKAHEPEGPISGMRLWGPVRPVWLNPLEEPEWLPASEASHMRPDDFILGITVEGKDYALPWWIMKNYHAANLTIGAHDLFVALCENCSSASCFDPIVEGQRLNFHVIGTYHGTIFMEDSETGSYWAPFTGECVYGKHEGVLLTPLPLYQCLWSEWLELHPETIVAFDDEEARQGHGSKTSPGSLEKKFVKSIERDRRLKPNVLVLGVTIDGHSRAYPVDRIDAARAAINDELSGRPYVLFARPGSLLGLAFSREVDGRILTFEPAGPVLFRDIETGSEWDFAGKAVAGPLTGKSLTFVPSLVEEWYAFAAARQNVEVALVD